MKYDPEKIYQISYFDPKSDNMCDVTTDSLARAVTALITRSRRHPDKEIYLTPTGSDDCFAIYRNGEYCWQDELKNADWQQYINHKLEKKKVTQ